MTELPDRERVVTQPNRLHMLAVVALTTMLSMAVIGCRPTANEAGTPSVLPSQPARSSSPAASERVQPSDGAPEAVLVAPDMLLGVDLVTEAIADGATVEGIYDPAIAERIAQQLGVGVDEIAATISRPADDAGGASLLGARVVVVQLPVSRPIDAIGAYLAEQLTRDGAMAYVGNEETDGGRRHYAGGAPWAVGSYGSGLVIVGFDQSVFEEPTDFSGVSPYEIHEALFDELLPAPPEPTERPARTPPPPEPMETPPRDPQLEARLPDELDGRRLNVVSLASLREGDLSGLGTTLPSVLIPHLGVVPADVSMAVAADEQTGITIWAHRVDGFSGAQLEAAVLGILFAGPSVGAGFNFIGGEIDGRRYTANPSWALLAEDDILYWILYFDVGDCFAECEDPEREPFLDVIEETIAAIPHR